MVFVLDKLTHEGDLSPLLSTAEATPGARGSALQSPSTRQPGRESPTEGHKVDERPQKLL